MGGGGSAKKERKARKKAEKQARKDAERFERQMLAQEQANQARLAQIQTQNQQQQAALEATMQANVASLSREPTTIKRRKRKQRGAGTRGMDRLRIAMGQQGTSTNLG